MTTMTTVTAMTAEEPNDEAIAATGHAGVLRSRRSLVLALSGLTAAVEVAFIAGWLPPIEIGIINLSTSMIPALVLGVACGSRLLGRSGMRRAAAGFWIFVGVLMPVLAILFVKTGRIELYPALILAALNEELVYRLAIPAVIAAALRLGNVRPNGARIASLVCAGVWFVLLPGHREQVTTPAGILPYVAFAGLSALIVYRSGSILPMAIGHAISNLLTVLMWREAVATDARSAALACALALLVLAYGRPRRITVADDGGLVDTQTGLAVTAIDLRDGQPALVELADGRLLPVHADMVRPPEVPMQPLTDDPDAEHGTAGRRSHHGPRSHHGRASQHGGTIDLTTSAHEAPTVASGEAAARRMIIGPPPALPRLPVEATTPSPAPRAS